MKGYGPKAQGGSSWPLLNDGLYGFNTRLEMSEEM